MVVLGQFLRDETYTSLVVGSNEGRRTVVSESGSDNTDRAHTLQLRSSLPDTCYSSIRLDSEIGTDK